MQYVRSLSGSVSKTWNSINPATLSGAIDVIVVELEDGMLVIDIGSAAVADACKAHLLAPRSMYGSESFRCFDRTRKR
jgi:stage V sporulation protein SpoVS